MERECNLEKFKIILRKPVKEFQDLIEVDSEELILHLVCGLKDEHSEKIVSFIQEDEIDGFGNVLNNLLLLEPFSSKIINEFIESGFLEENDFIKRADNIRNITTTIIENLQKQKVKIRKDGKDFRYMGSVEDKLADVINELKKHKNILDMLQAKKDKDNELSMIKSQIDEIEKELDIKTRKEIDSKLKYYQERKQEIDRIQKEINESKELYKILPKDGA